MSIRFSNVVMFDRNGFTSQFLLKGHPDEDSLRTNVYLLEEAELFDTLIAVNVQQYCFLTGPDEKDADDNHLALIEAYDKLANLSNSLNPPHRVSAFADWDDVEHGANSCSKWSLLGK